MHGIHPRTQPPSPANPPHHSLRRRTLAGRDFDLRLRKTSTCVRFTDGAAARVHSSLEGFVRARFFHATLLVLLSMSNVQSSTIQPYYSCTLLYTHAHARTRSPSRRMDRPTHQESRSMPSSCLASLAISAGFSSVHSVRNLRKTVSVSWYCGQGQGSSKPLE